MNTIEEMFSKIQADIEELKHSINGQIHIYKTILTHSEAAYYLGLKESYLHKLTSKRRITYFQPTGKMKYYKREDLDKYLLRYQFLSTEVYVFK